MRSLNLLSLVCLLLAAGPARAEADDRAKAKALYDAGMAHYNLTEYKEALTSFKEAYRIHHDAALLFNIAQCYRQLGDPASAASFYRSYRRESPDSVRRADVERLIREMDRAVQEDRARQPPTGAQPPADKEPSSGAGQTEPRPSLTPAAEPAATNLVTATAPPPSRPLVKRPWFWATVAGAAVVVAGAVVLGAVYGTPAHDPSPSAGKVNGN
jgi:tetratricopeptide (TPR) repeat protein